MILEVAIAAGVFVLLLGVMFPKFLASQNINTPNHFPDPNFRNAVEHFMGVPPGGRFSAAEAAAKTGAFACPKQEITDLAGIEYFSGVTSLNCSQNKIEELNLSHNAALETLKCGENRLTEFDGSGNPNLSTVSCYKNKIRALRLDENPRLNTLLCGENRLASLDLSSNTEIRQLFFQQNLLTQMDLSHNPKIELLDCSANNLTIVDPSPCLNLRYLNCSNNNLAELKLGNNAALENVYCASNQIHSLDVSQNNRLKELVCHKNHIQKLDLTQTAIVALSCYENEIEKIVLPDKSSLHTFLAAHNNLQKITPLFEGFRGQFPAEFDIRYNNMGIEELELLREAMKDLQKHGFTTNNIQYWPQKGMEENAFPERWLNDSG